MPHRLQNPKWLPRGPKMVDGVWKGVYPYVFGRSKQLSLNKFFDPSTPSMRKGRDGEKKWGKTTRLAAKGALANRLQRRTTCKIQNGRQGPQNGRGVLSLGFWAF